MSSKTKTTATKEAAKPALMPKLRFPEFRGAEGWHVTSLDSVCEILNNRRRPITGNERTPGPYPYYGASGVVDYVGDFIFNERLLLVGEDGAKWGAFEKTAFIADGRYWVNNHAHVLKPIAASDTLLENYLTMLDLNPFVTGAAPPKLTLGKLKGIPVPFPPERAEQQKIADCLSSVDELIAAQARKVEALKTHKKGLMQQLFPREGETQPRLRFPEFQNAGEWTPTNFGALGLDVSDGNYSSKYPSQSDFVATGVPFLRANNLKFGTVSDDDMRFISKEQHSQITKGHLKQGDVLITTRGELGTVALVPDRHIGSNINAQIVRINSCNRLVNTFLFQLLDYSREIGLFDALSTGTALKQLPIGKLNQLSFSIPEKREEQQHIADCLTSLDTLITAETQKHDTLKTHKKGLMQQLFPSTEALKA